MPKMDIVLFSMPHNVETIAIVAPLNHANFTAQHDDAGQWQTPFGTSTCEPPPPQGCP